MVSLEFSAAVTCADMPPASIPRSKRQYVHSLNIEAVRIARSLDGVKRSLFPNFIEPALATLAQRAPRGNQWLHEVKYDGYRFQCRIEGSVRFLTRRGHDWTSRVNNLVRAMQHLANHAIVFDGEVVVQTAERRSDFHALEKELKARQGSERLVYYVFDLLYLDGLDLRAVPLIDRKRILAKLLATVPGPIKLSEHLTGDGPTIWRRACELELEGIVSKRVAGRYQSGRTAEWIKATCRRRDTFVVVGWAEKSRRFDGLYLGRIEDDELVYAGKLEKGFSDEDRKAMLNRLKPLRVRNQPMKAARKSFPKARWVKPVVLIDAEFRGKSADGLLRHPSFNGIREDLMSNS